LRLQTDGRERLDRNRGPACQQPVEVKRSSLARRGSGMRRSARAELRAARLPAPRPRHGQRDRMRPALRSRGATPEIPPARANAKPFPIPRSSEGQRQFNGTFWLRPDLPRPSLHHIVGQREIADHCAQRARDDRGCPQKGNSECAASVHRSASGRTGRKTKRARGLSPWCRSQEQSEQDLRLRQPPIHRRNHLSCGSNRADFARVHYDRSRP